MGKSFRPKYLSLTHTLLLTPVMEYSAVVVVIVDASNKRTREQLDPTTMKVLRGNTHIPSVLVLNKVSQ